MDKFKGTPGKWKLYGATRSVLHGLVDPEYYQIKCNHKTIADKIESRADAQLFLTAKEMREQLIHVVDHAEYILHGENQHCDVLHQMITSIKQTIKKSEET